MDIKHQYQINKTLFSHRLSANQRIMVNVVMVRIAHQNNNPTSGSFADIQFIISIVAKGTNISCSDYSWEGLQCTDFVTCECFGLGWTDHSGNRCRQIKLMMATEKLDKLAASWFFFFEKNQQTKNKQQKNNPVATLRPAWWEVLIS